MTPRKNELVARNIFDVNSDTPTYSHTYSAEGVEDTVQQESENPVRIQTICP
ncbi:hypothetical protein L9Z17_03345 [Leptospira noguchii]|nr:hypothetical protein [Leptospira noguchii]